MADILINPFDNFFLFIIESQTNNKRVLTDLSGYKEAYLTFTDNNNYAVRIKSSISADTSVSGEINFTILSYNSQQIRKIKDRNFLISLIKEYPDKTSDETVIFTGTWDFFEYAAENNYNKLSSSIEKNVQAKKIKINRAEIEKTELQTAINKLEEEINSKELEKAALENILNINLAKLTSFKTSGFIENESEQNLQNKESLITKQANIVPSVATAGEMIAIKTRGLVKTQIK